MNKINIFLASKHLLPTTKTPTVIGDSLGYNLLLKKGEFHNLNTRTRVDGLGPCVKLTAWAEKNKFEAHSAPEMENIETVEDRIVEVIQGLRDRLNNIFSEIHAFITGGIEYNPSNPISEKSMQLIEEMYNVLCRKGIPTTVIAAQKGDGLKTRMNTLAYKENIYVYGKPIDDVIQTKGELKDALDKHFSFVELSDDIPVSILK